MGLSSSVSLFDDHKNGLGDFVFMNDLRNGLEWLPFSNGSSKYARLFRTYKTIEIAKISLSNLSEILPNKRCLIIKSNKKLTFKDSRDFIE